MVAYQQSKLANILFTMELKDRLAKSGKNVKPIVVHPGRSGTDLMRNMPPFIQFIAPIILAVPMFSSALNISRPAQGAESLVYAALEQGVKAGDFIGPTGKDEYTGKPGKVDLPPKAFDKELSSNLWALSENELDIQFAI